MTEVKVCCFMREAKGKDTWIPILVGLSKHQTLLYKSPIECEGERKTKLWGSALRDLQ